jgi:hypothetical protein
VPDAADPRTNKSLRRYSQCRDAARRDHGHDYSAPVHPVMARDEDSSPLKNSFQ